MLELLLKIVLAAPILWTLCLGILTQYYWVKPSKAPADESNRINRLASWWIGLTRPEVLAKSYKFFRQDVLDNVEGVERSGQSPEDEA